MTDDTKRRELAKSLDAIAAAWANVNDIPEVKEARAKSDAARIHSDELSRTFSRIFNSYTQKGSASILAKKYPGVILLGDMDDDSQWIARCAVTRMPIFDGDLVYISGGDEDYQRCYILAHVVTVSDETAKPVVVGPYGEPMDT